MIATASSKSGPALLALGAVLLAQAAPAMEVDYDLNLRYRYEYFDRDTDAVTPPGATSRASTLRLAASADATFGEGFGALVEFESVQQIGEDDYNIPTIPAQSIPGYPAILDPQGTELNQAFLRWSGPRGTVVRAGRFEYRMNEGRFISNSGWRQNHQSLEGIALASEPLTGFKVEAGHLTRLLRVAGRDASNGRTELSGNYYNLGYTVQDVGVFKTYGVLLDFDTELANSTDTFGLRYEANLPLGGKLRLIGTLDFARQRDAGGNPGHIDAAYRLVEVGLRAGRVDVSIGQSLLEGSSATDKLGTPLAHPFNGWTELFAANPSLGADNHGLDARYAKVTAGFARLPGLAVNALYYDYRADRGSARYGSEIDIEVVWNALPFHKNLSAGWRFGRYDADALFSDALRTSMFMTYAF